MISKFRTIAFRAIALAMAAVMCTWMLPVGTVMQASAEGDSYITEITIVQDEMATEILEETGYTALLQSLNPAATGAASSVFLGYQTGGEGSAIRDLKVSSSGAGTLTVDECTYQKISDISLNSGVGGSSLYLYASYDAEAGEPLRGLSYQIMESSEGIEGQASVLSSDGSEIVSTEEGEIADFDSGISGSEFYLKMYKGNIYRPYVEDVFAAKGKSEEAAIRKLAGQGCTYYVNYNVEQGGDVLMLGYTRTDDESKALRSLIGIADNAEEIVIKDVTYTKVENGRVTGKNAYSFYMTKDENAGGPIMDLVVCGYKPSGANSDKVKEEDEQQNDEAYPGGEEASEGAGIEEGTGEPAEDSGEAGSQAEEPSSGEQQEESPNEEAEEDTTIVGEAEDDSWWPFSITAKAAEKEVVADKDDEESESASEDEPEPAVSEPESDTGSEDSGKEESKPEEKEEPSSEDAGSDDGSGGDVETTGTEEQNDVSGAGEEPGDASEASEDAFGEDSEGEDAEEEPGEDGESLLAYGTRVYSEIPLKEWVSGYFLRGGSRAAVYLYDESAYDAATESDDVLWISNIYCSDKEGNQFVNDIGYVTVASDDASDSPFDDIIPYENVGKEEAESTASVFTFPVSLIVIGGMVVLILIGGTMGIVYKKRKASSK